MFDVANQDDVVWRRLRRVAGGPPFLCLFDRNAILLAFLDQHDGNAVADRVAIAIPRVQEKLAVIHQFQGTLVLRTDQNLEQFLADLATQGRFVEKTNQLFYNGLQPARPMYLFVTALDAEGRESRPSEIREVVLKDEFPFK